MSDIVIIDVKAGIARVVNNGKLFANLLEKFKSDQNLAKLESAFAENDLEKAKEAAHSLKGLSANLSLVELQKQCLEMESQIKDGNINIEQLNKVKETFDLTVEEINKVINEYGK